MTKPTLDRIRVCLLLALLCYAYSWRAPDADSDLWAHAAVGRWIWNHHAIPRQTLFLWTWHGPWIAHSWLSEMLLYGLLSVKNDFTGVLLVLTFTGLAVTASFVIMLGAYRSAQPLPLLALVLIGLSIRCSSLRFLPRPELVTDILFAILLRVLIGCRQAESRLVFRCVRMLVIFCVWANAHAGVGFGLIILWLTAVSDLVQYRADRPSRELAGAAMAGTVGFLINPYGFHYLTVYTSVHSATFSRIEEWTTPWAPPRIDPVLILYQVMVAGAAIVMWWRQRDRRLATLLCILLMGAAFCSARRNGFLLALTCLVPILLGADQLRGKDVWRGLTSIFAGVRAYSTGVHRMGWTLGVLLWVTWTGLGLLDAPHPLSAVATAETLPTQQVEFLQENHLTDHLYNDYNTSAYLDWRLPGDRPLFIDNLNAYPDSIFDQYVHIGAVDATGRQLLDTLGVDCVVGSKKDPNDVFPPLYDYLSDNPNWKFVYKGKDGPVWVRRIPKYHAIWQ